MTEGAVDAFPDEYISVLWDCMSQMLIEMSIGKKGSPVVGYSLTNGKTKRVTHILVPAPMEADVRCLLLTNSTFLERGMTGLTPLKEGNVRHRAFAAEQDVPKNYTLRNALNALIPACPDGAIPLFFVPGRPRALWNGSSVQRPQLEATDAAEYIFAKVLEPMVIDSPASLSAAARGCRFFLPQTPDAKPPTEAMPNGKTAANSKYPLRLVLDTLEGTPVPTALPALVAHVEAIRPLNGPDVLRRTFTKINEHQAAALRDKIAFAWACDAALACLAIPAHVDAVPRLLRALEGAQSDSKHTTAYRETAIVAILSRAFDSTIAPAQLSAILEASMKAAPTSLPAFLPKADPALTLSRVRRVLEDPGLHGVVGPALRTAAGLRILPRAVEIIEQAADSLTFTTVAMPLSSAGSALLAVPRSSLKIALGLLVERIAAGGRGVGLFTVTGLLLDHALVDADTAATLLAATQPLIDTVTALVSGEWRSNMPPHGLYLHRVCCSFTELATLTARPDTAPPPPQTLPAPDTLPNDDFILRQLAELVILGAVESPGRVLVDALVATAAGREFVVSRGLLMEGVKPGSRKTLRRLRPLLNDPALLVQAMPDALGDILTALNSAVGDDDAVLGSVVEVWKTLAKLPRNPAIPTRESLKALAEVRAAGGAEQVCTEAIGYILSNAASDAKDQRTGDALEPVLHEQDVDKFGLTPDEAVLVGRGCADQGCTNPMVILGQIASNRIKIPSESDINVVKHITKIHRHPSKSKYVYHFLDSDRTPIQLHARLDIVAALKAAVCTDCLALIAQSRLTAEARRIVSKLINAQADPLTLLKSVVASIPDPAAVIAQLSGGITAESLDACAELLSAAEPVFRLLGIQAASALGVDELPFRAYLALGRVLKQRMDNGFPPSVVGRADTLAVDLGRTLSAALQAIPVCCRRSAMPSLFSAVPPALGALPALTAEPLWRDVSTALVGVIALDQAAAKGARKDGKQTVSGQHFLALTAAVSSLLAARPVHWASADRLVTTYIDMAASSGFQPFVVPVLAGAIQAYAATEFRSPSVDASLGDAIIALPPGLQTRVASQLDRSGHELYGALYQLGSVKQFSGNV
ncbi:Hydroxyacylglutathione hydrolase [Carpediemonas membranifera]|uniref:Hydroxyacylglutathione hydrolase n=1 Tax=Carpediemonas membranifera TaxID=201153 RepID=A0A8J6B4G5_9EUKA|nr:Hydroxyacylglutathione hydrolase [Carpediemonas membranifera]|eukprot:KAG9395508.1 Hydroxyacylglutathione hydrolase [Carpediemonas membranifera]